MAIDKRELIVCSEDEETTLDVLGGYSWYVISKRAGPDGYPVTDGALEERFDSEEWAIICARQRLEEGWVSSEAHKTIAFSVGGGTYDDDDSDTDLETTHADGL